MGCGLAKSAEPPVLEADQIGEGGVCCLVPYFPDLDQFRFLCLDRATQQVSKHQQGNHRRAVEWLPAHQDLRYFESGNSDWARFVRLNKRVVQRSWRGMQYSREHSGFRVF